MFPVVNVLNVLDLTVLLSFVHGAISVICTPEDIVG